MRTSRIGYTFLALAVLLLLAGGSPQAFHSGGVAECTGCHSMHSAPAAGSYLLVGTDPSSTCLSCHMSASDTGPSSYHVSTVDAKLAAGMAPLQRTPGGDFGYVKKTYYFNSHGTVNEYGYTHGHNIVALDYAYTADPINATAPGGGTYPSSSMACTSCHNPHGGIRRDSSGNYYVPSSTPGSSTAPVIGSGSYGAIPAAGQAVGGYRLLRGLGDSSQGVTFAGVAIAVVPSTYNRTEATTQTRVAYGATGSNTWGMWCATCHPNMHSAISTGQVHPIDQAIGTDIANNYNAYVMSGNLTGSATTSFTSLVPFAEATADIATLAGHAKNDNTYLNGPASTDKVMCLSCHRAHASGWMDDLRWNDEGEFMVYQGLYPGTDNAASSYARGRLAAETQAAYHDRPVTAFAAYQRVLCNKCHAKD